MRLIFKILLPVLVLVLCVLAAKTVIANRPEPRTRPSFNTSTAVEATRLQPQSYTVNLQSRGEVGAGREGPLVAQVSGSITELSPAFVVGGSFRNGEVLAKIDPRDYEIALILAQAEVAQARATLAEEQARSDQAAQDWRNLGRKGTPSELVLRKPQLAAAQASLEGARGQLQRAQLDLDRTSITAMYDGRIRSKQADLGQYVNIGNTLAEVYSSNTAEIRLPFASNQLKFIDLQRATDSQQEITLNATVSGSDVQWQAKLVRTEGIDATSRQLYVVARVDNPYSLEVPLRQGQYVEAQVEGKTLDDVFVIPRAALRDDTRVLLVDDIGTLQSRDVVVEWKDAEVAVISDGLEAGEVLNITALGSVTNGTRVNATVDGVAPQQERPAGRGKPEGQGKDQTKSTQPGANQDSSTTQETRGDQDAQLQRLKAMIDAGDDIPQQARVRIQAQIDAGETVPPWLKKHIEQTSR